MSAYSKKNVISQLSNLMMYLMLFEKQEQDKLKISR
jgi:hypothetical protein